MRLADLSHDESDRLREAAALLYEAFRHRAAAWPDLESAYEEVLTSLEPGKVIRVALDADDRVIGWIGAQPSYDGHVWELHPLVVAAAERRRGVGRTLVRDLETRLAARGAVTLWLGSDDEIGETSLFGADLYDDLPAKLAAFRSGGEHPYPFYLRVGFRLVGALPDANGPGKPDIFLAKRIENVL